MKTRKALIAALTTLAGSAGALGQTATWNGASADWDTNNWTWNPNGAGFPDSALINAVQNNGSINLRAATSFTVNDFNMNGGSLTGPGLLTIKGNLAAVGTISANLQIDGTGSWTGGSWNSGGNTTTIGSLATFSIGSGGTLDFASRMIINNGSVTRTTSTLRSGGGGSGVTNNGLWTDANAANSNYNSDWGAWTFSNTATGTLRKDSDSVSNFVGSAAVNNAGLVEAVNGTLNIGGGGTGLDGAKWGASDAGVLNFSNSYTFAGTNFFQGNAIVNITGGVMSGTSSFSGSNLRWLGGNFNSGSVTTITSGSTFEIATSGNADFSNHGFVNDGTIKRTSGTLRGGGAGSGVTNNGLWTEQNAADSNINSDWGVWAFTNTVTGVLRKDSASITNMVGSAALNNAGLVEAVNGTLNIGGGGTASNGSRFKSSGPGRVNFSAAYTFNGTVNFEGDGPVTVTGGVMSGDASFTGTNLRWTGGNFNSNNTTTIVGGAMMEIAGGGGLSDFATHHFVNNGTIMHTSGTVRSGQAGAAVTNNGLWLESTTANEVVNGGYGVWTFNNTASGTLRKNTATVATFNGSAVLDNAGLVEVTDGTFNIGSGGSSTTGARFKAIGSGTLNFTGGYQFNDTNNIEGAAQVNLAGGNFTGTHTFTGQNLRWNGGTFNSVGTTTIDAGAALEIAHGGLADLNLRAFVNNGTITHTAGTIRGGATSNITNHALWLESVPSDTTINSAYGGTMSFTNAVDGTLRKTTAFTTFINGGARLDNAGLVDVQNGTLRIDSNGENVDGARFKASGSGVINFNGYQFTDAVKFEGDSAINLTSGTVTGTHTFDGQNLHWLGGTFNSAGITTVKLGSVMEIASGNADINTRTLVNNGTINHTAGEFRGGGSSSVSNHGVWMELNPNDANINSAYGGNMPFTNEADGVFRKTSSSTTYISGNARLNNSGLVDVQAGVLNVNGSGTNTDGARFKATGAGVINFAGYEFADNVYFEGDSDINMSSGTFSGTHTFNGNNLRWTGGNFNNAGTTTIGANSIFTILAGSADMAGRQMVNNGTVNHTDGDLRGNTNTGIVNNGYWNESNPNNHSINAAFGGSWTFHNGVDGTLAKTAGQNVTFSNVAMDNAGLIDAQAGTMTFSGGFTQSGGRTQVSGGVIAGATLVFNGGELGGNGTIATSVLMNDGSVTPGFSPGLLNITGSLTFAAPAEYVVDIAGLDRGTSYDAVDVGAGLVLASSALNVHVDPNSLASLNIGDTFDVMRKLTAGAINGIFDSKPEGAVFLADGMLELKISYVGGQNGRSVTLTIQQIVPTPGAASMMMLCGLAAARRKRR